MWVGLGFVGAALAQDPAWQACRPRALPLARQALFDGPLPPLRPAPGPATAEQAVAGHRLVATREGWWLDGAPATELGRLDGVVAAIAADLPAAELSRLFQALHASEAAVWVVLDAPGVAPAGSRTPLDLPPPPKGGVEAPADAPPGTLDGWNKVLGQCGPGRALVAPTADCGGIDALWKAVTENPRCLLPPRLVRDLRGPIGVGSPDGVAVEALALDPTHDAWLRPDQTWADLEPGAGWVNVGDAPWGAGPPPVSAASLSLRNRTSPLWPAGVPKKKATTARCAARVVVERTGSPSEVQVEGCDAPFAEEVQRAVSAWQWHPPVVGGFTRAVVTELQLEFAGGSPGALVPN